MIHLVMKSIWTKARYDLHTETNLNPRYGSSTIDAVKLPSYRSGPLETVIMAPHYIKAQKRPIVKCCLSLIFDAILQNVRCSPFHGKPIFDLVTISRSISLPAIFPSSYVCSNSKCSNNEFKFRCWKDIRYCQENSSLAPSVVAANLYYISTGQQVDLLVLPIYLSADWCSTTLSIVFLVDQFCYLQTVFVVEI